MTQKNMTTNCYCSCIAIRKCRRKITKFFLTDKETGNLILKVLFLKRNYIYLHILLVFFIIN